MITRRNRHHAFAPAFCAEVMEPRVLLSSATLVKDINTSPATSTLNTLGNIGDWAVFAEDDGVHGVELYRSNATTGGTFMLKDIDPGIVGSDPQFVATVGKTMFFSADDGAGRALWKTDGNIAGTIKLAQIDPTGDSATLGKTLIFAASDVAHGVELWKTNGTAAGTKLIEDFNPGPAGSDVQDLNTFDGFVYFESNDGAHGLRQWRTEGTTTGTKLAGNFVNPGQVNDSRSFVVGSNGIFFVDDIQGLNKQHLWRLNGNAVSLIATVGTTSTTFHDGITDLTLVGDTLYFIERDANRLWRTNGETGGLRRVRTFKGGISVINRQSITAATNQLYIYESAGDAHATIWGVKGSTVTALKSDSIDPPGQEQEFDFAVLSQIGNDVYFAQALPGEKGEKLWRSDGTAKGTIILAKFPSKENFQVIDGLTGVGSNVFFISADSTYSGDPDNTQAPNAILWKIDGTVAGTVKVKSLTNSSTVGLISSDHVVANQILYFTVDDNTTGRELWKSDGTGGGTRVLRDIFPGTNDSDPQHLTPGIGGLYFSAAGSVWMRSNASGAITNLVAGISPTFFGTLNGAEIIASNSAIYRSDGTKAGTKLIFSKPIHSSNDQINNVSIAGRNLFFNQGGDSGNDLWKSDGTANGTSKIAHDRFIDSADFSVALGSSLLFRSFEFGASSNRTLWRTDGTTAGTRLVKDLDIRSDLINLNGAAYFTAVDSMGAALFKTDGSAANTKAVKRFSADSSGSALLATVGKTLYFLIDDALWKSDGTASGTKLIKTVITSRPFIYESFPNFLVAAGNRVFFQGSDDTRGQELWTSDGTAGGTTMLKDIMPGIKGGLLFEVLGDEFNSVFTTDTAAVSNTLYFAADDGTHGIELWKTDGTKGGTVMLQDINPGSADSWPQAFAQQGNKLLFGAADALHGRELWQLPLA